MRTLSRGFAAFFVAGTIALAAQADSDSHYCIGAKYLAYELRFGQPAGHVLVVLREGPGPSVDQVKVPLPDFQVHGMRCTAAAVHLAGWDATYTVDLSPDSPKVSFEPRSRPGDLPNWPSATLEQLHGAARSAGSATIDLRWETPHSVIVTATPTRNECVSKLTARMYRSDITDPLMTLLERELRLECGE